MMTSAEYLQAWLYYLLGAILLIGCWWYATRPIPWAELRHLLRLVVIAVLLIPWYTNTQQEYLSPAFLIAIVEGLFEGGDAFWRAGTPLLAGVAAVVGLSLVVLGVRWLLLRNRPEPAPAA
ncbi:hypothetical protein [Teredinibacter turnerae]|uniref:hypothetical protein n=1 Tax=Teredinibacter turnerae TaxID=2426 RepID=UPI0003626B14|nr:hypothetical protein [Teredinibacter turnerae]